MARMGVPRYQEIELALREQVAHAAPGDPLPSDAELCARFGVSRMTARQAVQQLAVEGLLYRKPGHGTFVAERHRHHRPMDRFLSFSDEMRSRGATPSSRLLEAGRAEPSRAEAAGLELAPGELVVRIHRVRLADGVPMAIERVALPPSCAGVLDQDLASVSLHAALTAMGRRPAVARGAVTARLATADEAELLDVAPRSPLLVEERTVTDDQGRPLEVTESRYSGERYVFDVELTSNGRAPA